MPSRFATHHLLQRQTHLEHSILRGDELISLGSFPLANSAPLDVGSDYGPYSHYSRAPTAVSADGRWLAFASPFDWEERRNPRPHDVQWVELGADGAPAMQRVLHTLDYGVHALCFVGPRLFVAGGGGESQLGYFDLAAPEPRCIQLPIPFPNSGPRKRVDALLVCQGQLIAVDNVVLPKYLALIDLQNRFPVFERLIELECHGTWETIRAAALGDHWVAILSSTGSGGGPGSHISILASKDFAEQAWLKATPCYFRACLEAGDALFGPAHAEARLRTEDFRDWNDVAFCRDTLVVAAGMDGLGILDLADQITTDPKLTYRPLGIPNSRALYVEDAGPDYVLATYDLGGALHTKVVRVQ